ncbi:MAG: undecaprenyl-diphosphate phosphatase, partial [Candidatus Paceibacterota bacterium]
MSFLQAIILAITQGVTEFLPISSSGHLAILQIFWQLGELSISFDALLHFGTLGAILAVFYQEIKTIFKNKDWKIIKLVIIGAIPAALFGLLFQSTIENQFTSLKFIGFAFLITGLFLLLTKFIKTPEETSQQDLKGLEDISNVSWLDALIIGVAQSVALFPGISRSGM